jgi:hypothetical protein
VSSHATAWQIEKINSEHLHEALELLCNTTFFRLIQIDVNRECKHSKFWKYKTDAENSSADTRSNDSSDHGSAAKGDGREGGGRESSIISQLGSWMQMTVWIIMDVNMPSILVMTRDLHIGYSSGSSH